MMKEYVILKLAHSGSFSVKIEAISLVNSGHPVHIPIKVQPSQIYTVSILGKVTEIIGEFDENSTKLKEVKTEEVISENDNKTLKIYDDDDHSYNKVYMGLFTMRLIVEEIDTYE